jgi:hypothetical protein
MAGFAEDLMLRPQSSRKTVVAALAADGSQLGGCQMVIVLWPAMFFATQKPLWIRIIKAWKIKSLVLVVSERDGISYQQLLRPRVLLRD